MTQSARTDEAAAALMAEHAAGERFHAIAAEFGIGDLDQAYTAQRDFVRRQMDARHVEPVGYKIGLTSARMQEMCSTDQPIAGVILADRVHKSGVCRPLGGYGHAGLEFEIAVRMGADLTSDDPATVAAAVEAVAPAIEIIDDRNCDYAAFDLLTAVADNSWNAGVVLGPFSSPWPDLAAATGVVSADGEEIDRGAGRDILGHPFNSVAWLADHLARQGERLRAGDLVMTGSMVTTKFPTAACRYLFEVEGLGEVGLELAG